MALMLYTGCRRSDVVLLGPSNIKNGFLTYTQQKNRARKPITLTIPVHPDLRRIIEATPMVGVKTFLVTSFGKAFAEAGFGNWMRERCNAAGLPECSSHGLRKAIARRLAEAHLFVVRLLRGQRDESPTQGHTRFRLQDDRQVNREWRRWYWDSNPSQIFGLFNVLGWSDALPARLLSRMIARIDDGKLPSHKSGIRRIFIGQLQGSDIIGPWHPDRRRSTRRPRVRSWPWRSAPSSRGGRIPCTEPCWPTPDSTTCYSPSSGILPMRHDPQARRILRTDSPARCQSRGPHHQF